MLEIEIEILKSTYTVQTAPALSRLHPLDTLCLNASSPDFTNRAVKDTGFRCGNRTSASLCLWLSGHRPCRLFRGGFLGGGGYTRWNRTVWVVRSGVFEMGEAGCGAQVKSLSTWLRVLESYSRKRASMVKALQTISKYPTWHYLTPPSCLPFPPLCYLLSSFLMCAPSLCLPIASPSPGTYFPR